VFHGVTEPAQGSQRPPTLEKSMGFVETGVRVPSASCVSSLRYMAAGTVSKWVIENSLPPTGRSEVKSGELE
jgi:hypothetical protein